VYAGAAVLDSIARRYTQSGLYDTGGIKNGKIYIMNCCLCADRILVSVADFQHPSTTVGSASPPTLAQKELLYYKVGLKDHEPNRL
jgi:hypothetical protein